MDKLDHGIYYNTKFSMLVNGLLGEPFKHESYIFIICIEYLGRYIDLMKNMPKSRLSIKVSKHDSIISYLMLADNCIIFYKANRTQLGMWRLFWKFIIISQDNWSYYHKDGSIFKGTKNRQKHVIVDILQVPTLHSIRTYLECKILIVKETWAILLNFRTKLAVN